MTNKIDVELFIAMNEDGAWIVTNDESDAFVQLSENEGGYQARVVKITVKMSPPVMAEASVDVADDVGTVTAQS